MRFALAAMVVLMYIERTSAQNNDECDSSLRAYPSFKTAGSFGFLSTYFPPFFIQNGIELKSFIRSETFMELKGLYGDLKAVDAIYIHAMNLTNGNPAVSLLISTLACLDHRVVGLKIPFFNLFFPLSNESSIEFEDRLANLPKHIYPDSPAGLSGDRDKLQHFFGSAFISNVLESSEPAERFSDFIERGEDAVIAGGVHDSRDIRANREGQDFGLALLKNGHRLPSEFLVGRLKYTGEK